MSQQEPVMYNNHQLQKHLLEMRNRLIMRSKIPGSNLGVIYEKIDQIDDVLSMKKYFNRYRVVQGKICYYDCVQELAKPELIRRVKEERDKYVERMNEFLKQNNFENRKVEDKAYEEELKRFKETHTDSEFDEHMLDIYERTLEHNAFCQLKTEHSEIQHEMDVRRWLLGMIHRPFGYFSLALK